MQPSGLLAKGVFIAVVATASYGIWPPEAAVRSGKHVKIVSTGTWGGDHIILEVSEKGAEVEFDCAHGQVTQPMALNQKGDFDVPGTFSPEHGGPVMRDEAVTSNPARYSGHVGGDTMALTVTQGKENIGTFTLTRGGQPKLRKCR
jgi:hypothetical protein